MSLLNPQITFNHVKNANDFYESITNPTKNVVIFCSGFTNLELIISFLFFLKDKRVKVELIVTHNDYVKIFSKHYRGYYNHLWNLWDKPQCFNSLYDIRGILSEKKYLKELIKKINYKIDSKVIFFGRDFVSRDIYLIDYLKKRNKIYYLETTNLFLSKRDFSIKGIIKEKMLHFIYGRNFKWQVSADEYFTRISNSFLNNVKKYKIENSEIGKVFKVNKIIKIDNQIKTIYFDVPFFPKQINQNVHLLKIKILSKLNLVVNKKNIAIKFHPGRKNFKKHDYYNQISKLGTIVPDYIPSEMIDYNQCKLAIGFGSFTLSKRSIGSLQGICLTKLVGWDKKTENEIINQVKESNNNIFFPNNYSELENFIDSLKY